MMNNQTNIQMEGLRRWIVCFVLVTFDVDEGQKVQLIVPKIQLSQNSLKEVAMLSFPDSNSFSDYENSFKYTFRMYNGMFGYACFKQKKDPKNSRGFSQKSLVILSQLPFIHFFESMCEFIVFKTFNTVSDEDFPSTLESIAHQITKWPDPIPKTSHVLPILSYELQVAIPNYIRTRQKSHTTFGKNIEEQRLENQLKENKKQFNLKNILSQEQLNREGPFQQIRLGQIFMNCSQILWSIWQKVMLNKSILLIGANPQQISHAVLGVISLIYPFDYNANFNPYVTVYDPHLNKIATEDKNWVLGGTNPLFSKFFNKQVTQIIPLDKNSKCPKHLKPVKELLFKSYSEEQQAINESAIRKHFYQLSRSVMIVLDTYFTQQTNNLKFFDEAAFMKELKDRKDLAGLEDVFSSKKYVFEFFKEFIVSSNFNQYLQQKNAIRVKAK